ncbi:hypothetical protein DTO169C6_6354 [Paecilomyces variotii]|nr:hypothetical protein DTO169C6_6354 [Paecilomyces variotii]
MRSACPQDCDLIHGSLDDAGLLEKREPAPSSSIVGKCEQKECQHGLVIVATGGEWEPPAARYVLHRTGAPSVRNVISQEQYRDYSTPEIARLSFGISSSSVARRANELQQQSETLWSSPAYPHCPSCCATSSPSSSIIFIFSFALQAETPFASRRTTFLARFRRRPPVIRRPSHREPPGHQEYSLQDLSRRHVHGFFLVISVPVDLFQTTHPYKYRRSRRRIRSSFLEVSAKMSIPVIA